MLLMHKQYHDQNEETIGFAKENPANTINRESKSPCLKGDAVMY